MSAFSMTVRTPNTCVKFTAIALTSAAALDAAYGIYGDVAVGVTAIPYQPLGKDATMPRIKTPEEMPDAASLEIAYRKLQTPMAFENVMKSKRLKKALLRMARQHMKSRARFDVKKMQAHDYD